MILWAVAILLLTLIAQVEYKGKVHMCVAVNLTLSHLRSKEITGVHKPCIPHSNDSRAKTEYKPVYFQMYVTWERGGHQVYTTTL